MSTQPPVDSNVYNRFDERSLERLSGHRIDARHLFRVKHARPYLASGHIRDVADCVWLVASTRVEGRMWRVDLKTNDCGDAETNQACPDRLYNKKQACSHAIAAREAERCFLDENKDNRLIFASKVDDDPAQALSDRDRRRAALSYLRAAKVEL